MVYDEYDVESKSNKALISIAEDKSELCPIDQAIQCLNSKELDNSSLCRTTDESSYTDKQCSNLDTAMNTISISEISDNNYEIILEEDNKNNLPEQTVLYIMTLMFNNIFLRLINNCNNTLDIAKKHKVKVFNSQDIENNIEQFKILREDINIEFNNLLIRQALGVQYKKIFALLDEQPELLFAQIINLQDSLKDFELSSDPQDIHGTIERLQKCINSANTLLLSNTEQLGFKDINTNNAKKPFKHLINTTSVAKMLCDSLACQDIAGANPQYFRDLSTKIKKINKGWYISDFALRVYYDFTYIYSEVVDLIFSDNTLCFDVLDKINTNIRNYTRGDHDLNQKTAAHAEIKFLFAGMSFIVERIDAMIEPCFKPQDAACSSKNKKQQDINTQYSNELPGLNTNNTLKDQNPINMHSTEIENPSLHIKTKRSTDSIENAVPLSNENNLTNVVVDIINNDNNNTSTIIENENLIPDIIQDTPNDLINTVNTVANTNIQTTYTESKIEQEDHNEHIPHQANTNVNEKSTNDITQYTPNDLINTVNTVANTNIQTTYTESKIEQEDHNEHIPHQANTNVNEKSTNDITQYTPNDLINTVNTVANTNIQTTYTESKIEQEDHNEYVPHQANINVKASISEQPQKIMVASKIISTAKKPSANTNSAPKKYTNIHPYSISLNDIVVRPDIVTTVTFISINHINDKDATYHNNNINNSTNRTHCVPTTYQLVVNIYNEASIINNNTTTNTTTMFGEYSTETLNNNDINYIIGYRKLISNNLAKMQLDDLTSYNSTAIEVGILQHQQLYYNMTLSSNVICYPKLLDLRNFISSYKSPKYKEKKFEKRACDKILIDHTGYKITKGHNSFLEALNYGHKLFDLILRCTNTYQELHKRYPNKSIKELLLTLSLINNLDADERQNLTNIYMSITNNILGLSENTQYAQRMSFSTKLQPLILKHGIETPKHYIAHGIEGLAIDMYDSKLRIDDIEQDVTLRTASIPTYIDPQLGIKSISLAFTDSFGHMPLESEVLYMAIHYDNTGNIVAFHYPPTVQFIGKQPVTRTPKGNYFGPCTRDTIQQLERHISANESHNRVLSASMAAI